MMETDQFFAGFEDLVIGFNHAGGGYLVVELESDFSEKVNESVIDEIYQVIDDFCTQEGVSEVPVVFTFINITDDLAPANGSEVNESNNANLSYNKEKIVGNETTNQMPGSTSIMVVLGLLSLLIIKRS